MVMSELQLRQDVLDELEFEPSVDAAHVGVAVEKDVVTLSGHVASYAEKLAVVTATRRIRGVRAIADEIEVRHPSDKKRSDDEIAKRTIAILEWDTLVPSAAVQVIVRQGWLTLTGKVDWQYQKKAAEECVRKLSGIQGVINNIEIGPQRHAEVEAKGIRVIVRDNDKVLLEGTVGNWDERYAVENAAWSAPGVKSVEDRLAIA
jgi:osmotically-inducible protein OsmY